MGSVRDYAILWVGAGKGAGGNTARGGNALLTTAQHKLDGIEHLTADDTDRLDATVDEHGLMPKLSGDAGDVFHGDGAQAPVTAEQVTYDNAASGLTADDVQAAIDEVVAHHGADTVVLQLTNKSGGSVAAGDVVVISLANDSAFTTTVVGQKEISVGIAQASIANNAMGSVLVAGFAALVNVPASVTQGHYVETHTVAKQATGSATRRAGSFGQFLTGGTTPTAWLWGAPDQTASGGGSLTVEEVDGSPTDSAVTKIVFPNGTLGIAAHVATYTPAAAATGTGGRGESGSKYNPDHETPATTPAVAYEMNGSQPFAWSAAPAIDDATSYPGFWRFKGSSTTRWASVAYVPGATDLTLAAKISWGSPGVVGSLGIGFGNGTGTPTDAVLGIIETGSGSTQNSDLYNLNSGSLGLVSNVAVLAPSGAGRIYIRLTRVNAGPTWAAYFSADGVTWLALPATGSKALTVGAIVIRTDQTEDWAIDWIRVWTSVVEKVGA